jgi:4-diphosphocytidyl-2-C-methyl-D-erythritol kinase
VVLCKPEFSISTPALFAKIDGVRLRCRPDTQGMIAALEAGDLHGVARRMYNVFEDALPERQHARVNDIKNVLIQCGALGASMSGTGPTAFGLFDDEGLAQEARERLGDFSGEVFLTQTV